MSKKMIIEITTNSEKKTITKKFVENSGFDAFETIGILNSIIYDINQQINTKPINK